MAEKQLYGLTLSGILAGVTIILLYLAVILPFHTFFFSFLGSFPLLILYPRTHPRWSLLFFVTTALLSLLLFAHPRLLPYLLFLGPYTLFRGYIGERREGMVLIYKFLFFNALLVLGLTLLRSYLLPLLPPFPLPFLFLLLQILFLLYDFLLTQAVQLLEARMD